ncbi:MAG: YdiU family protein [Gammaproteobacteria bacterium]
MPSLEQLRFDNSFARLPEAHYSRVAPQPFDADHHVVSFNPRAAALLDLDPGEAERPEFIDYLTGRKALPGSDPLAMLYAGHQFGVYVPQLGDGRAILLGEVRNTHGEKWDIQLKGSGPTPYSRGGDGRAVLRSSIREYLCSEAMHGLGIPTTRALCVIGTEAPVYRETEETGALLARLAPSHVRFGHFEVFFYRDQHEALRRLADYVIDEHFPELADAPDKYLQLLRRAVLDTARLIAHWQSVGFAHGVMNTDNMSILGLTIDYGPFGFLDAYDSDFICNHSDHTGRYAFGQQPQIGLWNLTCLAQALTPLIEVDAAREALDLYESAFVTRYLDLMRAKLGLREHDREVVPLVTDLLELMGKDRIDYTRLFRRLCRFDIDGDSPREMFDDREAFDAWADRYRARLATEGGEPGERAERMRRTNPKYILRNYLAQQAIAEAERGEFAEVDRLLDLLADPFAERPDMEDYAAEPPEWAGRIQVSCSS